jgi:hypothetical protein
MNWLMSLPNLPSQRAHVEKKKALHFTKINYVVEVRQVVLGACCRSLHASFETLLEILRMLSR